MFLETGKFKVKILADQLIQVVRGSSLTSLQIGVFSLYPHMLQRTRPKAGEPTLWCLFS